MSLAKIGLSSIRYLTPDNLYEQLRTFTAGMAVTKGEFELLVERCSLEDVEWNHMDQMHRLSIHRTYEKGVRIALGKNFAVSLTQWGKWPFFITVNDVYVAKGLFYQSLTIAGIIFLHSIISMEERGGAILLRDEWFIASHKIFKFMHKPLNKKLYKLNQRLQEEDKQIRQGRFELRERGFKFRSEPADYYSSNVLTQNTIYPSLPENVCIPINDIGSERKIVAVEKLEFIVQKTADKYLIWPAVCPHEGGPLASGKFCEHKVSCPWHGLQFLAVELSTQQPYGKRYAFEYQLEGDVISIKQVSNILSANQQLEEEAS